MHKPWTILFYLCGDNPLDGLDEDVERELRQVLAAGGSPDAHVAVQRDSRTGCARWLLEDDHPAEVAAPTRWLGKEVDSANPETLREFLLWGLQRCPSDSVALVLSGAGLLDDRAVIGTPTSDPDRVFTICDDWTARSGLEVRELAGVLDEVGDVRARTGAHPRLDIVAFDMCRMQFLEVAAELNDCADLVIGPQTNVEGWDYGVVLRAWFDAIAHGWQPAARGAARRRQLHALADVLVTAIGRTYRGLDAEVPDEAADDAVVVSALDLTQIERVLGALDTMSLAYLQSLGDRVAWDARTAAVSRLGHLQENKSYDAHAIFREVSRALGRAEIDASVTAYSLLWMCQAEPRELKLVLRGMDRALRTWLLEDDEAHARVFGARQTLLEGWVRPTLEQIQIMLDRFEGHAWVALSEPWQELRSSALDVLARLFGFPSLDQLFLVIVERQQAWQMRHRLKRAADKVEPAPAEGSRCARPSTSVPEPLLTAAELSLGGSDRGPGTDSIAEGPGLRPHMLDVWVRLLDRCSLDDTLPPPARGEFSALLRERKNARHLRRLVGRTRSLLAPPRPGRSRRGLIAAVHPPPAPRHAAEDTVTQTRSGLSLYRPRDLTELTRASYLELRFNRELHWTALLTAIHLIADRPNQLWQVLSSLLSSARERGRQELLAQLAGPDAVLRIGSQFESFAPVPMVTLSLERAASAAITALGAAPDEERDRPIYQTRLMSTGREAVIHEQHCRVNQTLLNRLLAELDAAVAGSGDVDSALGALGAMLGEDVLSVLADHLEGERQRATSDDVHLQLQLPRDLLHFPWEIVRDRHGTLGARYALARQVFLDVGLSSVQRVRRAPRREKVRVLVVNPRGSVLPAATREAEAVVKMFRRLQRESGFIDIDPDEDVHIDEPVTVAAMRGWLRSGRYDVVHFCGHAHFDAERPERSAWRLSDDILEAEQIRNTLRQSDSPPWLVYANACSAGRDVVDAERPRPPFLQDLTGLASAFINAGVAAYMGPLWPVVDGPACDLAQHFYEQLVVRRTTMGAALREARTRLMTEGGFAWASLVLYGDSTATLMQRLGSLLSSANGHAADASSDAPPVAVSPAPAPAPRTRRGRIMEPREQTVSGQAHDPNEAPAPARARGSSLTPEQLQTLRGHVVNLREGRFSTSGRFTTSQFDVDTLFDTNLSQAWTQAVERGEPLHVVLWAHGGLTDEGDGLGIAYRQVRWWLDNRVYPIFFVWETGLLDALSQILGGTRGLPRAPDVWDYTTDLAVEAAARAGGVGRIWSAMKRSAELAAEPEGGARYVARKLAQFCQAHPPANGTRMALHAVGHSAGSIFHAHFLPAAFAEGLPDLEGLHLLAPAVRTDTFKSTLSRHIGNEIRHASMFTMARDYEESDSVGPIYHKSLLYLVSRALEREDVSPILGLETSLRGDAELARTFGLSAPTPHAEVVWAVTSNQGGRAASTSRTHGGFDNNAPTMNSVLRRVLARADNAAIVEYPKDAEERAVQAIRAATRSLGTPAPAAPAGSTPAMSPGHGSHSSPQVETGRRRALCVGIDDYASAPLAGCVADANAWKAALEARGFEVTMLVNEAATRQALMTALETLVKESEAGDVAVFQYAGHGTQLPDANPESDEDDGQDEAFCPFDMDDGAFLVDDDVRGIFAAIPAGVNVTCFIDCCHSGSISRAGGVSGGTVVRTTSVRPRFIRATAAMKAAHRAFRKKEKKGRATRAALPPATLAAMKQVVFSACQDREVAYESDGHGDFTTRALPLLAAATNGMTHDGFQQAVIEAFGAGRRQSPNLECAPAARDRVLLAAYRFPFFSSDIR